MLILALCGVAFGQVVRTLDDGAMTLFVHNNGTFGYDPYLTRNNPAGLYYPGDSRRSLMAGGGIWVAGKVNNEWRITISGDLSEFKPGPWQPAGTEADSAFPIYKITRGENYELNDDYRNWPTALGAPTNAIGEPLQLGGQGLWTMFHDGDSASHIFQGFSSVEPLGVEVRLHAYTWDNTYQLHDTLMAQVIFFDYTITNVSDSIIDSCIITIYADPDIGFSTNDRLGTNQALQCAYVYDEADFDSDYGDFTPVVGMTMLRNHALSANYYYGCRSQYPECIPVDTLPDVINVIKGLKPNGQPYFDPNTSLPTLYPFGGNPVDSSGWIADVSRDYRFLLNTIPDTLRPGESTTLTTALVVARGTSNRDGVGKLLEFVGRLRELYQSDTMRVATQVYDALWAINRGHIESGRNWGGRYLGGAMDFAGRYLGLPYAAPNILPASISFTRDSTQKLNRFVPEGGDYVFRDKTAGPVVIGYVGTSRFYEGIYLDKDGDGTLNNSDGGIDPIITSYKQYSEEPITWVNQRLSHLHLTDPLYLVVDLDQSQSELVGGRIQVVRLGDTPKAIYKDTLAVTMEPFADTFAERTLSFTNTTDFATEINIVTDEPLYVTATPPQLVLGVGETKISFLSISGRRRDTAPVGVSVFASGLTQHADRFVVTYGTTAEYVSGDIVRDRVLSIADLIEMVRVLYRGAPINVPLRVVDPNCDSRFNLVDLILFVNHLFEGAPLPCEP